MRLRGSTLTVFDPLGSRPRSWPHLFDESSLRYCITLHKNCDCNCIQTLAVSRGVLDIFGSSLYSRQLYDLKICHTTLSLPTSPAASKSLTIDFGRGGEDRLMRVLKRLKARVEEFHASGMIQSMLSTPWRSKYTDSPLNDIVSCRHIAATRFFPGSRILLLRGTSLMLGLAAGIFNRLQTNHWGLPLSSLSSHRILL